MQEQKEKRSDTRHDSQWSLWAHVQVFSHQRLRFAGWLAEEERKDFSNLFGEFSSACMCQGCDCTCSSPAQQSTSSCSKILSHAALMVGFLSKGCLKSRVICNVSPALQDLKNEISQFTIYFMFKKLIYYTFGLPLNSSVS